MNVGIPGSTPRIHPASSTAPGQVPSVEVYEAHAGGVGQATGPGRIEPVIDLYHRHTGDGEVNGAALNVGAESSTSDPSVCFRITVERVAPQRLAVHIPNFLGLLTYPNNVVDHSCILWLSVAGSRKMKCLPPG